MKYPECRDALAPDIPDGQAEPTVVEAMLRDGGQPGRDHRGCRHVMRAPSNLPTPHTDAIEPAGTSCGRHRDCRHLMRALSRLPARNAG